MKWKWTKKYKRGINLKHIYVFFTATYFCSSLVENSSTPKTSIRVDVLQSDIFSRQKPFDYNGTAPEKLSNISINNFDCPSCTSRALAKKDYDETDKSRANKKTSVVSNVTKLNMNVNGSTPKLVSFSKIPRSNKALRSPSLRRLKREWKDAIHLGVAFNWSAMARVNSKDNSKKKSNPSTLVKDLPPIILLGPINGNLLQWHFSYSGPINSTYDSGIYHGRVLLPKNYPLSPPRVQMLTPSGRFQPGVDICLSASNFHPETWTPKWTIYNLIQALRLHMLTSCNEIGSVMASDTVRRELVRKSRNWQWRGIMHSKMSPLFFPTGYTTTNKDKHNKGISCVERIIHRTEINIASQKGSNQTNSLNTTSVTCLISKVNSESLIIHRYSSFDDIISSNKSRKKRNSLIRLQAEKLFITLVNTISDLADNPILIAILMFITVFAVLN